MSSPPLRRHRVAAVLVAFVAVAGAAAACGGSSPPPVPASPSATAGSGPLPGDVRAAAAAYWQLIDAGDYAAIAAAGVPGEPPSATAATDDIAHARLMRVDRVTRNATSATDDTLAEVLVYIEPQAVSGQPTPWGDPGEHTLFMYLQKAPQGGWLVRSWGTGP